VRYESIGSDSVRELGHDDGLVVTNPGLFRRAWSE
jgi:hypothetical protein